jgi:outer membrane protein OmpA-like peptidoglycan-associated protein
LQAFWLVLFCGMTRMAAAAVRSALIPLGIVETRLVTSGFGSSVPRDTNTTLAGRARNRRVELTLQ